MNLFNMDATNGHFLRPFSGTIDIKYKNYCKCLIAFFEFFDIYKNFKVIDE